MSTPPDSSSPTPTPSDTSADFETALEFTKLVHSSEYKQAADLVVPESPAARYLAHQTLYDKAMKVSTGYGRDFGAPEFDPDPAKGSVKISFEAAEGQPAENYTWKAFKFDGGKITTWTGASGPVADVLWSRETRDESRGRKAVVKSAYLTNGGDMVVVVELSTSEGTGFGDAEYTAEGGYRQGATEQGARDIDGGEKTLAYFGFEDSEFGGRLHIPYYDEDGTSQGDWELDVAIK